MACSTRARRRRCQRHLRSRTIRFPRNRGVTKLGYAAIATVGQHTFVVLAQLFYGRASVVNRIISVAGSTGDGLDDVEVSPTDENLGVARPSIVLRFGSVAVVAGLARAFHRRSTIRDDPVVHSRRLSPAEPYSERPSDVLQTSRSRRPRRARVSSGSCARRRTRSRRVVGASTTTGGLVVARR